MPKGSSCTTDVVTVSSSGARSFGGCCDGPSLGWEKARLRVVCCSVVSTSALAAWLLYSAVALSGGKRESHDDLLVEEKGIEMLNFGLMLS